MLSRAQILTYDTKAYPFARVLEARVFKVKPLERLHRAWQKQKRSRHGTDHLGYNDNLALRSLMQNLPEEAPFIKMYHAFVHNIISPRFGGRISYSNRPKMRVHLAGTPTVSTWHRDVDVTDRPDQINAFLPFTSCFGTNTLWCESTYGAEDFQPIELEYGEVFLFDGGYLQHGSVSNETDTTRVSLDFRFAIKNEKAESPWTDILAGRPPDLASARQDP